MDLRAPTEGRRARWPRPRGTRSRRTGVRGRLRRPPQPQLAADGARARSRGSAATTSRCWPIADVRASRSSRCPRSSRFPSAPSCLKAGIPSSRSRAASARPAVSSAGARAASRARLTTATLAERRGEAPAGQNGSSGCGGVSARRRLRGGSRRRECGRSNHSAGTRAARRLRSNPGEERLPQCVSHGGNSPSTLRGSRCSSTCRSHSSSR
jgi:hypothetical protein